MKHLLFAANILIMTITCSEAQIQTIVVSNNATLSGGSYVGGTLSISSNSIATLKSFFGNASFKINTQNTSLFVAPGSLADSPLVIAGPATIQILGSAAYSPPAAFATFDVEPGPFPPGKTATVGAYSGNVQVTMQMSTDLVNWTTATNGMVYTNSPDARFFRIQLITNASP